MCLATVNSQSQTIKKGKNFLTSLICIASLQHICIAERKSGASALRYFRYLRVRLSAETPRPYWPWDPPSNRHNMRGSFPGDKNDLRLKLTNFHLVSALKMRGAKQSENKFARNLSTL